MKTQHALVAPFKRLESALAATRELAKVGVNAGSVSIVAEYVDVEDYATGCYDVGYGMQHWGRRASQWRDIWTQLNGAAFFVLPGTRPLHMAGPLVKALLTRLTTAAEVSGSAALLDAMATLGVPVDSLPWCKSLLGGGSVLVLVHGDASVVDLAAASIASLRYPAVAAMA